MKKKSSLIAQEFDYLNSLSQATLESTPNSSRVFLYFWFITIVTLFVWSYFAQIDQLVRGESQVVIHGQNQVVQNLEGGIVDQINAEEGSFIQEGDVIIKIKNQKNLSGCSKNLIEMKKLKSNLSRLELESKNLPLTESVKKELTSEDLQLFYSNKAQIDSKLKILSDQIQQKEDEKKRLSLVLNTWKKSMT